MIPPPHDMHSGHRRPKPQSNRDLIVLPLLSAVPPFLRREWGASPCHSLHLLFRINDNLLDLSVPNSPGSFPLISNPSAIRA